MSGKKEFDNDRRQLLSAILVGGAAYAAPTVATLSYATPAEAQVNSSSDGPGRPDSPGANGLGADTRPAEPGEGGRRPGTGRNPAHDAQQSSPSGASGQLKRFEDIGKGFA